MAKAKRISSARANGAAHKRHTQSKKAAGKENADVEAASPTRAFWTGSISFGLLQIPVGVYTAEVANEISFRQLDRHDLSPIGYERVNKATGEPVAWEDIVKGYEYEKGEYVVVTDEELKSANVEATQTIDIQDFVDVAAIDPVHFERPYYLAPLKKSAKAYALLREALARTQKAAVATVVMRTREHLCALFPRGDALVLEVLRFAHELRSPEHLGLPTGELSALRVSDKEIDMAVKLVDGMTGTWNPSKYHDTFRDQVLEMIETKVRTGEVPAPSPAKKPRVDPSLDLMSILQKSLEQAPPRAVNDNAPKAGHAAKNGHAAKSTRATSRTRATATHGRSKKVA